jgi:EPS-associated MarR family transcriptional regulator
MKFDDAERYQLLRIIAEHPEYTQRDLSAALGMSVGKINFCVKALVRQGLVEAGNSRGSWGNGGPAYLLTPKGAEDRAALSVQLLQYKRNQLEALRAEIAALESEQIAHERSSVSSLAE